MRINFRGACWMGAVLLATACLSLNEVENGPAPLPVEKGPPATEVATGTGSVAHLTTDGQDLYAVIDGSRVVRFTLPGGTPEELATDTDITALRVDGTSLYYVHGTGGAGSGTALVKRPKDGSGTAEIVTTSPFIHQLFLTPGHIVIADFFLQVVVVIPKAAGSATEIHPAVNPQDLTPEGPGAFQLCVAGSNLLFTYGTQVQAVPLAGGTPTILATLPNRQTTSGNVTTVVETYGITCNAERAWFSYGPAFTRDILSVPVAGGEPTALVSAVSNGRPDAVIDGFVYFNASCHPDGTRAASCRSDTGSTVDNLKRMHPDGTGASLVASPAPDGDLVALGDRLYFTAAPSGAQPTVARLYSVPRAP